MHDIDLTHRGLCFDYITKQEKFQEFFKASATFIPPDKKSDEMQFHPKKMHFVTEFSANFCDEKKFLHFIPKFRNYFPCFCSNTSKNVQKNFKLIF